jgi:small subunit ribosomal protein S20
MTTSISSAKRVRTSEKARAKNIAIRTKVASVRRKTLESLNAKDAETSAARFREYCSTLDKAVKKGVLQKNTSIRRKRRAATALAAMKTAAQATEKSKTSPDNA